MENKVRKTEEQWRKELTPDEYRVLRERGTERPLTGKYVHTKEKGMYRCAACGNELFSSETKFDSGTGWPSFFAPAGEGSVAERPDTSAGMRRTEVVCNACGSHLGHIFDDGPLTAEDGRPATGRRFCINSVCLSLDTKGNVEEKK